MTYVQMEPVCTHTHHRNANHIGQWAHVHDRWSFGRIDWEHGRPVAFSPCRPWRASTLDGAAVTQPPSDVKQSSVQSKRRTQLRPVLSRAHKISEVWRHVPWAWPLAVRGCAYNAVRMMSRTMRLTSSSTRLCLQRSPHDVTYHEVDL